MTCLSQLSDQLPIAAMIYLLQLWTTNCSHYLYIAAKGYMLQLSTTLLKLSVSYLIAAITKYGELHIGDISYLLIVAIS